MTSSRGDRLAERPITVVHVDDDPGFTDLVRRYLEREEKADGGKQTFRVISTGDPTDAAVRLDDRDVDCVVSDVDMPGTDGLALARSVRDSYPDLPFVLFTGTAREDLARQALAAGVTEIVRKGGGTDRLKVLARQIRRSVYRYRKERTVESDDGGMGSIDHERTLQQVQIRREPARETADGEAGATTEPLSARTVETERDHSVPRGSASNDAPVDSDAIRDSLDDAWSARKPADASTAAEPDTRLRADENGLRRLFANLESSTADRGVETTSGRPAPLPDGVYLEKRRDDGPGVERPVAVGPAGTASGEPTDIEVDGIRQIALEYGWRTRITTGSDDQPRIEFERADRPTTYPR